MVFLLFIDYSTDMNIFSTLLNVDRSPNFYNEYMLLDGFAWTTSRGLAIYFSSFLQQREVSQHEISAAKVDAWGVSERMFLCQPCVQDISQRTRRTPTVRESRRPGLVPPEPGWGRVLHRNPPIYKFSF